MTRTEFRPFQCSNPLMRPTQNGFQLEEQVLFSYAIEARPPEVSFVTELASNLSRLI